MTRNKKTADRDHNHLHQPYFYNLRTKSNDIHPIPLFSLPLPEELPLPLRTSMIVYTPIGLNQSRSSCSKMILSLQCPVIVVQKLFKQIFIQTIAPSGSIKVLRDIICFIFYETIFVYLRFIIIIKRLKPLIKSCIEFVFIRIIWIIKDIVVASILKSDKVKMIYSSCISNLNYFRTFHICCIHCRQASFRNSCSVLQNTACTVSPPRADIPNHR